MPALLLSQRGRAVGEEPISQGPPPSFFDTVGAAFRVAEDEQDLLTQAPRDADAYRAILDSLRDSGVDVSERGALYMDSGAPGGRSSPYARVINRDAIIAEVKRQKARNPKLFPEVNGDRAAFERDVATRFGARRDDQNIASRGGIVGNLAGGMGSALTDPVNLTTGLLGGGGSSIARAVLSEALIGAVGEAALLPDVASAKARMGEDFTALDMAERVGTGALASGVFGGVMQAAPAALRNLKGGQEAALARIIPMLPEKLRPSIRTLDDVPDDVLADLAERSIGTDNITPTQKAAITVARRESELKAINPFERDPAGVAAHFDGIEAALARILKDSPAAMDSLDKGTSLATLRGSTGLSTGTVAGDAESIVLSRIRTVESAGSNVARNPNSSALGPYQFLRGTWLRLYKSRYGAGGMTDDAIAAKRTDPAVNDILIRDLMAINRSTLRGAGIAETPGNLYLAHFAGPAGARKLHAADANASARDVLGDAAVNANRFLERMTARDVIAWADRKMGGKGPPANDGPVSGIDAGDDAASALMRMMDANNADIARIEGELNAPSRPLVDDGDVLPVPVHEGEDIPVLAIPRETVEVAARDTAAVEAVLPQLRSIVASGVPLRINDVARTLGVDVPTAQRALGIEAARPDSGLTLMKNGAVRRTPPPVAGKPPELLTFIARNGGIKRPRRGDGQADGWATQADADVARHDLIKGRNFPPYAPGGGFLFKKDGMTIDEIGALLGESGYFAPDYRPSQSEVLDMLDRAVMGEKIYPLSAINDVADIEADARISEADAQLFDQAGFLVADEGFDLDDAAMRELIERYKAYGPTSATDDDVWFQALRDLQRAHKDEIRAWAIENDPNYGKDPWDDGYDSAAAAGATPVRGDRSGDAASAAGRSGASGGEPRRAGSDGRETGEQSGPIDPQAYAAFDEPDGPGVNMQSESTAHDLRAAVDPAIAERQRQQATLKAASPMRSTAEQDGVMGSPLFDAVDQRGLDLGAMQLRMNAEGDPVNLADILADIDADDDLLKTIKDCL